jgi:hypothetical protein
MCGAWRTRRAGSRTEYKIKLLIFQMAQEHSLLELKQTKITY